MTTDTAELIAQRHDFAQKIVASAAQTALGFYNNRSTLAVEVKGLQDWVSNADKTVEDEIRAHLVAQYPDDGIVGEEHENREGSSGFLWVIDPIDGTTNFVNGNPGWCVVLACVYNDQAVGAVIADPISGETFTAIRGQGCQLNGQPVSIREASSLSEGTVGVGHNLRTDPAHTLALLNHVLAHQGMFRRSGSGALDLAYVAAGRLVGYMESHMNAWDCIAALLMIEEAGGVVEAFDMQTMLASGGSVVTASPGLFDELSRVAHAAFNP